MGAGGIASQEFKRRVLRIYSFAFPWVPESLELQREAVSGSNRGSMLTTLKETVQPNQGLYQQVVLLILLGLWSGV